MRKTIIGLSKGRIAKAYINYLYNNNVISNKPDESRKLYFETENYTFTFLKPMDIIKCLSLGIIDLGVIGSDVYENVYLFNDEYGKKVFGMLDINLFNCSFALAAPKNVNIDDIKRIAVSSELAAFQYFYDRNSKFDFEYVLMDGSLEIAPFLGYADAIVDIVETGETIRANDLEIKKIFSPITTTIIASTCKIDDEKVKDFVRVNERIRQ